MLRQTKEVRVELATKASLAAAKKKKLSINPDTAKYGSIFSSIARIGSGAKQRCTNPAGLSYADYGGRGIEFRFASVRDFARWILDNIGPPPPDTSLDRIDNNRHYEPGNLRWATRVEQARNKRAYRKTAFGERVRRLHAMRPDLSSETVRTWTLKGMTDEEIIARRKYVSSSV